MNRTTKGSLDVLAIATFALALIAGAAWAAPQYLDDGAAQNDRGGWDLPYQGYCGPDNTIATRPECIYTRFPALDAAGCAAAGGSLTSATSRFCKDGVNNTIGACVDSAPDPAHPNGIDRLWTNGECVLTMKGYNRNEAVCTVQQGGTWTLYGANKCVGAWQMPASNNATYWDPLLFTSTTNPGPGDQCLRCHRSDTEWNGNRVRDVEGFLKTGHKNMARRVEQNNANPHYGLPWGGPPFGCSISIHETEEDCLDNGGTWDPTIYPSNDGGLLFDWPNGEIDVASGTPDPAMLYWIYGDWLGPLPRAIYDAGSSESTGKPLMSYSCARCHTTGWTSDATIRTATVFPDIHGKQPEQSLPGVTWDGSTLGTTGKVNLAGGVTGDSNLYASWDNYGITCSRCHGSTIEDADGSCSVANLFDPASCTAGGGTWTAGNPRPAAYGRGATHQADLTNFDVINGGYCSLLSVRNATKYTCEFLGGAWYSACSDDRWQSEAQCIATTGCVNEYNGHGLNFTSEANCEAAAAGECSNPIFTASVPCAAGGGTWTAAETDWWVGKTAGTWKASYCSLGTCSNVAYTTQPTCVANGGTWTNTWTNLFSCMDAGGHWTGNKERRGQMITNLCMDCHRQETGGLPYDSADPAGKLKVGPAHGSFDFVSHPHGNWFLNSPHAKFSGSFAEIPSAKFEYDMSGKYKSWFMTEGEAANTGNGCTGCHDVHQSTVPAVKAEDAIHETCTDCHAKDLGAIFHPPGKGTPLEAMAEEPAHACVSCHMPHGRHLFRINPDAGYSTLPKAAITAQNSGDCTAAGGVWGTSGCTVNAPQADHEGYSRAVWIDVDMACGQCHGGGTEYAESAGDSNPANAYVVVDDATGFLAGERVIIEGAGAVSYDDESYSPGDFETFIKSIAGNTLNLLGKPALAVTDARVIQNPTANGAGYMNKASLANLAKGIHNDAPVASFVYTLGNPNTKQVTFSAAASTCGGSSANCDVFEWDFGDGQTGTGIAPVHTYAAAGTFAVTLTVEQYGVGTSTKTKNVTTYATDYPPTLSATCVLDPNSWLMTVTDTGSSDDHALTQGVVNWGDGSLLSKDLAPPFGPFTHTYANAGSYIVTYKIADTVGQVATKTCTANPATFSIGGVVHKADDTTPVAGVTVKYFNGTSVVKTVYTDAAGNFLATGLKPGAYTLLVTKNGWSFPNPAVNVGPSNTTLDIDALADGLVIKNRGKSSSSSRPVSDNR